MKRKFIGKTSIPSIFALCTLLVFFSCQNSQYPKGIKHVVVIGIDGMSVQGFLEASTPCMDSLLQNGAYSYKVRCVLPTSSKPNWNAMLSGAGPEVTGVIDNSWKRNFNEFPPVAMSEHKIFPNIFLLGLLNPKPNRARIQKIKGILNSFIEMFLKFRAIRSP